MTTDHALERIIERVPMLGDELRAALTRAEARFRNKAVAVVLGRLPAGHPQPEIEIMTPLGMTKVRGGDTIVAIIRDGKTATVMLRQTGPCARCLAVPGAAIRCTHRQEMTPAALAVNHVVTRV